MPERLSTLSFFLSLSGVWISFYSQHVKSQSERDEKYSAYCDVGSVVSCTKVFRSKFGDGFGLLPDGMRLSNGECGVVFYSLLTLLSKYAVHRSLGKIDFDFGFQAYHPASRL